MLRAGSGPVRRRPWAVLALLLAAVLCSPLWLHGASAGAAGPPVGPCENTSVCVGASTPPHGGHGGGGGGGGAGGVAVCVYNGNTVPCTTGYGSFDPNDGCYYQQAQPQPPAGDPDWHGHLPGDGAVYSQTCPFAPGGGGAVNIWLAAAPAGPPVVTPAELAQRALAMIQRSAATVGTAPDAGGARTALVGSPIWLWIDRTGTDYATRAHPLSATAAVPGLAVTANVYVTAVDWNMGDGSSARTCTLPGTPYRASDGAKASPDCGYSYAKPSIGQPDERYAITATVHWIARWNVVAAGGPAGTIVLDPIATPATTLRVSELQVLN
ncbi:ATP/GTP-binding protein [Streptacidiphilus cavernicola]|uniref:ATP/GTP-binding protein n=1 Tax=Streptacidiphilus cavernicola TaxID=3342716 RepID=A0ABV6W1G6_9ACTN